MFNVIKGNLFYFHISGIETHWKHILVVNKN